jgi:hypothetical protein
MHGLDGLPIDPMDFEKEIADATEAVRTSLERFQQVVTWAREDLDKAPPEERTHRSLVFLAQVFSAEHQYDMRIHDSMAKLTAKMVLDLDSKEVLALPQSIKEAMERVVGGGGEATVEGIGTFQDLLDNVREPKRPRKE